MCGTLAFLCHCVAILVVSCVLGETAAIALLGSRKGAESQNSPASAKWWGVGGIGGVFEATLCTAGLPQIPKEGIPENVSPSKNINTLLNI